MNFWLLTRRAEDETLLVDPAPVPVMPPAGGGGALEHGRITVVRLQRRKHLRRRAAEVSR